MFSAREEQSVQVDTTKLGIPASLVSAIYDTTDRRVQGVDSNLTALIYVEEHHGWYAIGIRVETTFNGSFFTERHDLIVDSPEKAIQFFSQYNLGDINWIKAYPKTEEELIAAENYRNDALVLLDRIRQRVGDVDFKRLVDPED